MLVQLTMFQFKCTPGTISRKLVNIKFIDTFRVVRHVNEIESFYCLPFLIYQSWLHKLWDYFTNLGASAMTFHESRSVCYGFSQISERLPGLILKRGAKSQMLRASEIFWERLWNVYYQKMLKKSPIFRRSRFPNLHIYNGPRIRVAKTSTKS